MAKRLHRILLEQLLADTSNQVRFCGLFAKENYGFDHWFSELIMLPQPTVIRYSLSTRQERLIEPFKLPKELLIWAKRYWGFEEQKRYF